jgi:hypothetical protein
MSTTYSFKDVKATIVGPGGFINLGDGSAAAEEGIEFAPSEDIGSMQIGADGSGIHSLHADQSGVVTCRFLKNSPANQLLSAMAAFQRASGAAYGNCTIECRDTQRGDVWVCTQVGFKRIPNVKYAKDADVIVWEFNAIRMQMTLGS